MSLTPEQATLRHALQRGLVTTEALQRAHAEAAERSRAGRPTSALERVCAALGPAAVEELRGVYQRFAAAPAGLPADVEATAVPPGGFQPPPPAGGADRRQAEAAYREAAARDPAFAPHAKLAFDVVETLGEGGMGVVLRVRDRRLDRQAALKRIRGEADPGAVARFRREAEITARLDHPSIPPVYEAGTDPAGNHYMLMKVIEGEPLSARIKAAFAGGPPPVGRSGPVGELLEALVKVGEAIAYAHSRGVLHRDLKPANVMVGRFGEVLVLDWGLARRTDRGAEDDALLRSAEPEQGGQGGQGVELTQAGSVLGTLGYMAPEQAEGEADERSDVFGLGAILVAILTDAPPIEGATAINRLKRTLEGRITLPRARRRDVPAELNAIAEAALRADPARRTRTAQAFVRDLRAYLAGEPVSCHRYSLAERLGRWARRHPALVAAGSVAAVLVAVGVGVVTRTQRTVAVETRQAVVSEGVQKARDQAEAAWAALTPASGTGAALRALTAAERWRSLAKGDAEAEAALARAARRLGALAIAKQEWDLAGAALALVDDEQQAEEARKAEAQRRTAEVRALLAKARSGELARTQEGIPDAVYRITRYPEPATVALLAKEVRSVAAELLRAEAEVLRSAGDRPGLEAALKARAETPAGRPLPRDALQPLIAAERAVARQHGVLETARAATRRAFLAAVADRQAARVTSGHLQAARLAIEALGRLGIEAGAVEALAEYVKVEADDLRAQVAVQALSRFSSARATEAIQFAGERRPQNSYFRNRVRDLLRKRRGDAQAPLPKGATVEQLLHLGNQRETQGDLRGALAAYVQATKVAPRDANPWISSAMVRQRLKDYPRALADAEHALRLAPKLAGAHAAKGLVLANSGEAEGALASYARALELDPGLVAVLINRGQLLLGMRRLDAARASVDEAVKRAPDDADAWVVRGEVRRAQGELLGAVEDCTHALKLDPTHAAAHFNRGTAQFDRSDWREAARDFRRALELDPKLVPASNGLGRTFLRQGLPHKAVLQATASLRLDPNNLAALWLRSAANEEAGKLAPAIADLERMLRLAPNHALAPRVRARLEQLRARR